MAEQKMLYDVVIHSRDNLRLQISIPTDYKESLEELSSRDIRIQEYKDGQLLDYQVTGETFSGVRYDAYSVVESVTNSLIMRDGLVSASFIDTDMQNYIDTHREVAITHDGVDVLKSIYSEPLCDDSKMDLDFVTNKYAYYSNVSGSMAVVDISNNQVITNIEDFCDE